MSDSEDGVSRRGFLRTATAGTAAAAGVTGAATAQEGTTTAGNGTTGTQTTGNQTTTTGGSGGGKTVTVSVSTPDNDLIFKPGTSEPLYITPGTTVEFVWKGNLTHNVSVKSQPSGASWEGHESLETAPFTYSHTFETLGTYDYVCTPHESRGMVGTIVVNASGQPPAGGGYQSILPDSAQTLGVAATGTMVSVLGLTYFFLKYGGDYGELE
ncbi:MAG: plastocyanin/azurin family copper-binding protein [Halobacteriaceae archaeon]